MMSQAVNKPEAETIKKDIDFGKDLAEARKAKNFTVEEISNHIKIPVNTIVVLESSDLAKLPAPTFAKGYLRAYAKFLEISEDSILEKYSLAVPQEEEHALKPRSNLPDEANSQSPLVKSITMLLIVAGVAAVIFGGFKYYQEKAGVMEGELDTRGQSFTGNSLDSPGGDRLSITQDARLSDDDELIVGQSDPFEKTSKTIEDPMSTAEVSGTDSVDVSATGAGVDTETEVDAEDAATEDAATEDVVSEPVTGNDVIEFFAEDGSWMEVRDANKARLFYNMVPVGGSKVIIGKAPFSVTMGNAKTTKVVINDLEVDMSGHIRRNNTAVFSISTNGQDIIIQ